MRALKIGLTICPIARGASSAVDARAQTRMLFRRLADKLQPFLMFLFSLIFRSREAAREASDGVETEPLFYFLAFENLTGTNCGSGSAVIISFCSKISLTPCLTLHLSLLVSLSLSPSSDLSGWEP